MAYTDPQHKKAHRRKRNPCGSNAPRDVTNISGTYQKTEGTKHNAFRLRVQWTRVTQTMAGEDYKPDAYGIQLWGSKDGTTWEQDNIRHKQVRGSAGPDGDWDTEDDVKVPNWVVFRGLHPKWHYQVRVRALSKKECDGTFGAWVPLGTPNDQDPPKKPLNVKIHQNSTGKRVVIDWDPPRDPDDDDLIDEGVTFFQIQLSKTQNFSTIYKFDRSQAASFRSFRIDDDDLGDSFYGRVRSIDAAGNKSAWIPATHAGNSSPTATAQAAAVGSSGGEFTKTFNSPARITTKLYEWGFTAPRNLKILAVNARVGVHVPHDDDDPKSHPSDGTPQGGSIYIQLKKYDENDATPVNVFDADSRLEIQAGHHKASAQIEDAGEITNPNILKGQTLFIKVAKDVDNTTFLGKHLTVTLLLEPA